jgi:predicted transcriptional regulator
MKKELRGLGLTENEVDVYLALLRLEDAGISKITNQTGLHRQVCYDVLDRLMEKGFVSYVLKNGKKHFNSLEPKKIIDLIDKRKEGLENILPVLMKMTSEKEKGVSVELVKGKSVLKTIYNDIFRVMRKTKKPMYAMGITENKFLDFDPVTINQHIRLLKKHRMKEYLLSKQSAKYFFGGKQSNYRLLPDHMFNPNPTHVYGNRVAIIIWGNPVYGILIKSKQMANAYKKYFKLLWGLGKPRKKNQGIDI